MTRKRRLPRECRHAGRGSEDVTRPAAASINDGSDLPEPLLASVYYDITHREIKTGTELCVNTGTTRSVVWSLL